MKLFTVHDDECTYAIKPTLEEANTCAREVWLGTVGPQEDMDLEIGQFDTDDEAPHHWQTIERIHFAPDWGDDEDE